MQGFFYFRLQFRLTVGVIQMLTDKKNLPAFHIHLPDDISKEAYIHYTDHNGKRKHKKGGINRFKTVGERLAAAQALVKKLQAEYKVPTPIVARMVAWVEARRGHQRTKGFRTYQSKFNVLQAWLNGRDVSNDVLKVFFAELLTEHHTTTYNAFRQTYAQCFKEIGLAGLLDGIGSVKTVKTPQKYFQEHQAKRLKKALVERWPDLWLLSQFVYYCFLRPGRECRLLRVGDIYFDDWKINVPGDRSKNKKTQFVTIPKAFRKDLEHLKEWNPSDYVFPSPKHDGKPIGETTVIRRYREVLDSLGFSDEFSAYSWKHTGAVACIKAGISLKELQIQLRHHSLDEVDKYLRQLGVWDLVGLEDKFPAI